MNARWKTLLVVATVTLGWGAVMTISPTPAQATTGGAWTAEGLRDAVVGLEQSVDYAGSWVDARGTLHVASVTGSLTPSLATGPVVLQKAKFDHEELVRAHASLSSPEGFDWVRRTGGRFVMVGIDDRTDQVVLTVAPGTATQALASALRTRFSGAVAVSEGGAAQSLGKTPKSNFTVRGGSWIDNGTWVCTSAFNLDQSKSAIYNQPRASFLTAAHCFDQGDAVENGGGVYVGHVTTVTKGTCNTPCAADVEMVGEYYNAVSKVTGVSTSALSNGVHMRAVSYGPYITGSNLCKLGVTSGTTCGTVQQTNVTVCYANPYNCYSGMLLVSNDYCHGDSGGPDYAGNTAEGIVSGRTWTGSTQPACGGAKGLASSMGGVRATGSYPLALLDLTN